MNLDKQALVEIAKSFGRFLYFGILGLVGTFLTSLLSNTSLTSSHVVIAGTSLPVGILIVAGLTGVIKLVDRYQHVSANTDSKGIAPKFLQG